MRYVGLTEIGNYRAKNQDSYLLTKNSSGDVLTLVADGIGGNKAGEVASLKVMKYFQQIFPEAGPFQTLADAKIYLQYHIKQVNALVHDLATANEEYEGMGTTLTGLYFSDNGVLCLNVGDSRCYGENEHEFKQLSEDDSMVAEMIRLGKITPEEGLHHPQRHFLTKAIGIWESVDVKIKEVPDFRYYLVCSDGLCGYLSDEEMLSRIRSDLSLEAKAEALRDAALEKGGYDNITLILVENEQWQK